jgi:hypothetical protein
MSVIVMGDADYVVAPSQYKAPIMRFSGTLTAARNCVIDTKKVYQWVVHNNTTGGYAITIKTLAGTGISVSNGKTATLYCDGTNVLRVTADI